MANWTRGEPWYHGSPLELSLLRAGSTVTQERALACAFSHKPTLLCLEDDGRIRHNGSQPGYLYRLAEEVGDDDLSPHPRSSMSPGLEWLTRRDLRLERIGPVALDEGERLSGAEVAELLSGRARPDGR